MDIRSIGVIAPGSEAGARSPGVKKAQMRDDVATYARAPAERCWSGGQPRLGSPSPTCSSRSWHSAHFGLPFCGSGPARTLPRRRLFATARLTLGGRPIASAARSHDMAADRFEIQQRAGIKLAFCHSDPRTSAVPTWSSGMSGAPTSGGWLMSPPRPGRRIWSSCSRRTPRSTSTVWHGGRDCCSTHGGVLRQMPLRGCDALGRHAARGVVGRRTLLTAVVTVRRFPPGQPRGAVDG